MPGRVVLITGAGTGFGLAAARALAAARHTVYGGLQYASQSPNDTSIHDVVCDITSTSSVTAAVDQILAEQGRLDCVVHNAGHMCTGPAESFSPEDLHRYFEINAVGAHRLNQAVLPLMRRRGRGHIVWMSSTSVVGAHGPLLAPYFAAKAAMHSLAVTMSMEIACWGIETTLVMPSIFPVGTSHFATAGRPTHSEIAAEYMDGPLKSASTVMMENIMATFPKDATPQLIADAVLEAVDAPAGKKPYRIMIDAFEEGVDEVLELSDQKRLEMLGRCRINEICALKQS